jgi:hypothetical protein
VVSSDVKISNSSLSPIDFYARFEGHCWRVRKRDSGVELCGKKMALSVRPGAMMFHADTPSTHSCAKRAF